MPVRLPLSAAAGHSRRSHAPRRDGGVCNCSSWQMSGSAWAAARSCRRPRQGHCQSCARAPHRPHSTRAPFLISRGARPVAASCNATVSASTCSAPKSGRGHKPTSQRRGRTSSRANQSANHSSSLLATSAKWPRRRSTCAISCASTNSCRAPRRELCSTTRRSFRVRPRSVRPRSRRPSSRSSDLTRSSTSKRRGRPARSARTTESTSHRTRGGSGCRTSASTLRVERALFAGGRRVAA